MCPAVNQKLISSPIRLYRHLMRRIRSLPVEAQEYYKHYTRQSFNSHADERDPDRIQQIMDRAIQDADWIIKKKSAFNGEEMAFGQITAKVVHTLINIVFCVIAIVLVMVGAWLFSYYYDYDRVASDRSTLVPACVVSASGIFLLLVGILGFVVTFKETKWLTLLFLVALSLLFVALVVGSILAYVYRKDIDAAVDEGLKNALEAYANDEFVRKEIDMMQTKLECCGVENYTDWLNTTWYEKQKYHNESYPASCCINKNCTYEQPDENLHQDGCYSKVKNQFIDHLTVVGCVAIVCAAVLLFGMIFAAVLITRRSQDVGYNVLIEPDGLRV